MTALTWGAFLASATEASTADWIAGSVRVLPAGTAKTIWAAAPAAPGNFWLRRSIACCDWVPGMENAVLAGRLKALDSEIKMISRSTQKPSTTLRCRNVQRPIRYKYVAIACPFLAPTRPIGAGANPTGLMVGEPVTCHDRTPGRQDGTGAEVQ